MHTSGVLWGGVKRCADTDLTKERPTGLSRPALKSSTQLSRHCVAPHSCRGSWDLLWPFPLPHLPDLIHLSSFSTSSKDLPGRGTGELPSSSQSPLHKLPSSHPS